MADSKQTPAAAPPSEMVGSSRAHTRQDSGPAVRGPVPWSSPAAKKRHDRHHQLAADRALVLGLVEQAQQKRKGPTPP